MSASASIHSTGFSDREIHGHWDTIDRLGGLVEKLMEPRDDPRRSRQRFDHSPIPMVMVDRERRVRYANLPARLVLRYRMASLQLLQIDDLTPAHAQPQMETAWRELRTTGRVSGGQDITSPTGGTFPVVYCAQADAQRRRHLIAFVPAELDAEDLHLSSPNGAGGLTARELEVLELAAEGLTSKMIADQLVVSVTTVSTHFRNIYEKLRVRDRSAAVATGLRLGLIV